jgi:hypothetical protein
VIATIGKRWRTMSKSEYIGQSRHTDSFWMSFHELVGDYPWLVKRMGAVRALAKGQEPSQPRRHPMAMVLALFVPRLGVGGGGGLILTIAVIGMLVAVGIPACMRGALHLHDDVAACARRMRRVSSSPSPPSPQRPSSRARSLASFQRCTKL